MKPMERLVGVVAAGFLLLFGIYLTYGYHFGPFGHLSGSWRGRRDCRACGPGA